jgi:hypothetical protein
MMNQHPDLVHHLPGFGPPPTPWYGVYMMFAAHREKTHLFRRNSHKTLYAPSL